MPNDDQVTLEAVLGMLEEMQDGADDAVYSTIYRNYKRLLKSLNTVLSSGDEVTTANADRVLRICLQHKTDVRYVPYVLAIISTLINIDKENPIVDFLPSAIAILDFFKTMCLEDRTSHLQSLSFQVLMLHPKSTLTKLVGEHTSVLVETFGLFLGLRSKDAIDIKMESFIFLRLFEWLPAHEKFVFVKEGIPLWLTQVVPTLVEIIVIVEDKEKVESCISHVELLVKELLLHDYFEYLEWQSLLESIINLEMFPKCIQNLLEKGGVTWHRIWIMFIKMLKNQVTKNVSGLGSPINSMLPVVETAFKKESMQRVRAFLCWNELVENFSNETNAQCITKRIKLLMIPLRLNNAKTLETNIAKFNTWWLLIRKFTPKMTKFTNDMLIPFLHFMFGKDDTHATSRTFTPSQSLRQMYLEAFNEIMGHLDCSMCDISSIARLNGSLITTSRLTDHWKVFIHALKSVIRLVATDNTAKIKANIQCLWNMFVLTLTDLTDNSLRRDLFDNLINILSELATDCETDDNLTEIVVDNLALPLFKADKIRTLIISKSENHRPMHKIVKIIMANCFDKYYKRFNSQDLTEMLTPVVSLLVDESVANPAYMVWLLDELPSSDSALKLWTVLVRAVTESEMFLQVIMSILRWPLNTVHGSSNVKEAASAWYTLYNIAHMKLENIGFDKEISKVLTRPVEESKAANYFIMFALVGVLKHKPDEEKMAKLEALTYEMNNYEDFEQLMPSLIDTLVLMIDNVSMKEDENVTQITINCVQNVLNLFNSETELSRSKDPSKSRKSGHSELRTNIPINKAVLSETLMSAMKAFLAKCPNESIKKQIRSLIASLVKTVDEQAVKSSKKIDTAPKEFTSPKVQSVKKNKSKEASIVNTVVENGEEYVVVKSNWKFNPKNLTENQKEKFQRKRDIPALYQDLSQSQDEFKLSTWKADSQDNSLSSSKSSKSATNNDVAEIFRNMPSTDVVPKIMGNILDSDKNIMSDPEPNTSPVSNKLPKVDKLSTPIGTKSPRMALKDRVFRNVRNLIEKSSPQNEVADKRGTNQIDQTNIFTKPNVQSRISPAQQTTPSMPENNDNLFTDKQENKIPNISELSDDKIKNLIFVTAKQNDKNITLVCTPTTVKKDINVTNSAPSLLVDRPARMKRTPRKFDDSLLLAFKKSRHLKNDSQLSSQDSQECETVFTVAQVHSPGNYNTEKDEDAVIEGEIVTPSDISKDKSPIESHNTEIFLISPTTPITEQPIEKSPERPTTGEVPSNKSKSSAGMENAIQIVSNKIDEVLSVNTPLNKLQKTNAENDGHGTDHKSETIITLQKSVEKSVVEKETNENIEKSGYIIVSQNKAKEDSLERPVENKNDVKIDNINAVSTTPKNKIRDVTGKSSTKKTKKSRIEKELMIDTVEGHPFLKVQSEKRLTRKKIMEVENSTRRKSLAVLNKSKLEATPKSSKKPREKKTSSTTSSLKNTVTVEESQNKLSNSPDEPPCSEDIIESSQDSTMTTISVKSSKKTLNHQLDVVIEKISMEPTLTQDLIQNSEHDEEKNESADIEFPQNKTVAVDKIVIDLTENMDTESMSDAKNLTDLTVSMDTEPLDDNASEDLIVLSETLPTPITLSSELIVGPETQEFAEADTQPNEPKDFINFESFQLTNEHQSLIKSPEINIPEQPPTDNDITQSLPEAALILANMDKTTDVSSPFKDDSQRKQDFLNNTLEISPIKIQSADTTKSPSRETSSDFVVIKLSSPVYSNGERFDKHGSPEFFTEDKVSPDKRDASPPRAEVVVSNTSPSTSLSLKKNRPQVRPGGRAAQMLGLLCVNSDLKVTMVADRTEPEETKKSTSIPARRNLRILYNSVGENIDYLPEQNIGEDSENFLKLKRNLPTVTSSPSGPILKRKLVDITDETTASPASKRKRVSFHDPPVSTTISVSKYIEPLSLLRSPQSSAKKRLERQTRLGIKSPKRLENAFNLDTVLSKAVESFTETTPSDDTENISLDVTPLVEIINTSELNDTDPICPELIDCKDPIDVIATELSSPTTRELFVKELEGKIETVGDLAKMTELEVNRLCIKAPKIKVARKVLSNYVIRPAVGVETAIEEAFNEPMAESLLNESKTASVEMQTDIIELSSTEMQTVVEEVVLASTQTDGASTSHMSVQTDESGSKTTAEIISCLSKKEDFMETLSAALDDEQLIIIAEKLSPKSMFDLLKKSDDFTTTFLNRLLKHQSKGVPKNNKSSAELSFVRDHLFERYESKDLILLCSQLLHKIYDKPA